MLFIHPQSAGHGLNLQHGGSTLVFFDLIYSLEYYLQTVGRIDRQGQKNPVVVELLVAEGTRDEYVADRIQEKKDAQEGLFVILKRLIRKFRKELEMTRDVL
jgi:SNF2 family DNA or RNA helicase